MTPKKILVRMPNWIGDLVMAIPVLIDLRKHFPDSSITAMCVSPICELLKKENAIDELYCFSKPKNDFLRREDKRNIIAKIEAGKYDTGVLLTNSFSSAWWFWQGKVKTRIGYSKHFRRFLLTKPIDPPKEKIHQVDFYKRLLEPLGISKSKTEPRLILSEEEISNSKKLLHQRGYRTGKKLIGINPGAAYGSAKCWLPENFRELAQKLLKKTDAYLLFFGDSQMGKLIQQICQDFDERVLNLAGVTSLRELASIIHDLDLFITNDSGPMHIAAALKTPLIALFGSTDEELTGPYGQEDAVIRKKVSCSPCFKRKCPIDFRCMKGITVDAVLDKAERVLKTGRKTHV